MKFGIALAVSLVLSSSVVAAQSPPVEHIGQPSINGQRLPFSEAVRVGDMLYLSGQIGTRPDGTLPAGIEAQARQTMDNIGAVLKRSNLGFGDVAKCTVMLDNMADWPAFNKVYVTYFPDGKFPARSAFGADGLALGALLEVECWAYAGKR
jgi:reactive intermediate/imine deaminase